MIHCLSIITFGLVVFVASLVLVFKLDPPANAGSVAGNAMSLFLAIMMTGVATALFALVPVFSVFCLVGFALVLVFIACYGVSMLLHYLSSDRPSR